MSVHYTIQADVFDIGQASPRESDCFLVDSNVLLWMTYSKLRDVEDPKRVQIMNRYADFVNGTGTSNSKVCYCGLSLAELAHIIEKTEREIYVASAGAVGAKEYRQNFAAEREQVISEIEAAWAQVTSLGELLPVTIDSVTTAAALNRLQTERVDGYDLFILESMRNHGVVQVITDDGDFATVPGIQVFTANNNVIKTAHAQGRLISR
ncbi:PIN domain-containing protein [Oligosphaera ethanolica]|uniref:Nucleic acid-binding protein n=1 Tax=Oligosphaera ethanolica TaxID=760260 RepID=A0AAE3VH33_9BACT|nr:PIN domain-containing protein [Oligosphaera ethanolica]MDQ0290315.1 putative nucleic acid-binding protein [Oligosphaera ethanolica]